MQSITPSALFDAARRYWRTSAAKSLYLRFGYKRLHREWLTARRAQDAIQVRDRETDPSAMVIIPPDPLLLRASKGDDAMLSVLINAVRAHDPRTRIVVGTCSDVADNQAKLLGIEPVRALDGRLGLTEALRKLLESNPSQLFLVGADVLDGSYDPRFTLRLLALTDLAARRGVTCSVTGFSFSTHPFPPLSRAYSSMIPSVRFNLRDPASRRRFDSFSSARSIGVADMAFLLHPEMPDSATAAGYYSWIDRKKCSGRSLIGVNIHPLLLSDQPHISTSSVLANLADTIIRAVRDESVSVVLISHDFRGSAADRNLLDPLYSLLARELGDELLYVREEHSAAELKGLASRLDGVISGRMHLSIASLGGGTPVLGLNYKDKMEGLFEHFGFAQNYAVSVGDIVQPDILDHAVRTFVRDLPLIKKTVGSKLPRIVALASLNVATLDAAD